MSNEKPIRMPGAATRALAEAIAARELGILVTPGERVIIETPAQRARREREESEK